MSILIDLCFVSPDAVWCGVLPLVEVQADEYLSACLKRQMYGECDTHDTSLGCRR